MPQTIHFNSFWFDFQADNLSNDITKNGSNLTFDKKADNFFLDEKKGNDHDGDDVLSARLVGQVDLSNDAKNGKRPLLKHLFVHSRDTSLTFHDVKLQN